MQHAPYDSGHAFLRSLTPRQRAHFLQRERDHAARLQAALRALSQGLSEVSALNGEALALAMEDPR